MRIFSKGVLPVDMLEQRALTEQEAGRARRIEDLYHIGQEKAWDGREAISALLAKHGQTPLPDETRVALSHVFSVIMWGELAAWKVAAQLADQVEPLEARMAATSQAHDEARHFYVMRDYLRHIELRPTPLEYWARNVLEVAIGASDLPRKLAGMQLQVETFALSIFHHVRQRNVDPVLSDLLLAFEKDEARHIGFGVQFLPVLMKKLGRVGRLRFALFQLKMLIFMLAALKRLEPHVLALGITPRDLILYGAQRQLALMGELVRQAGFSNMPAWADRVFDSAIESFFPAHTETRGVFARMRGAFRVLIGRDEGLSSPVRARLAAVANEPASPALHS